MAAKQQYMSPLRPPPTGYDSFPPSPTSTATSDARPVLALSLSSDSLTPSNSTLSYWDQPGPVGLTSSPNRTDSPRHPLATTQCGPTPVPFPTTAGGGLEDKGKAKASPSEFPIPPTTSSTRLFQQLEEIKRLQAGIAKQHAQLEGIRGAGENDWVWAVKGKAGGGGEGKPPGEDGTEGEAEKGGGPAGEKENTAKAYASMEREFKERHQGVSGIVSSLASLSSALKTLHALPSPVLFPPSPQVAPLGQRPKNQSGVRAETAPHEHDDGRPLLGRRRISFEA